MHSFLPGKHNNYLKIGITLCLILPFIQSCGIFHPNRMMDTDKSYQFQAFLDSVPRDFIIQQGDVIELFIFPKKGYALVESQIAGELTGVTQGGTISLPYLIDQSEQANLPMVGWVKLGGLTEHQAEEKLTLAYSAHYIDPFVNVSITNKYATVYRGSGESRRIPIERPDVTVLDIIAAAGGIPESGKSENVKVIRKQNGIVQTQELDLSGIEGIYKGQYYVQPNDIIYIEPNINSLFFKEVSPVIGTISGLVLIYAFLINLGK